jgi:two-component system response regulator RegA
MNKLVLVDDDEALLRTLTRRFSLQGAQVVAFSQPQTAAGLVAEQAQGYLLDLRFGQQSGLEFVAQLRQALPQSRIIILTGYASISTAVQAVKLGADDYLTKPVDFAALQQALTGAPTVSSTPLAEPSLLSTDQLQWEHIQRALALHQGNISQTARSLGMHRRTLQRKLLKHRP